MSSKARVTIEVDATNDGVPCSVELFLNAEAIRHLILELGSLSESKDHFHWFAPEWGPPQGELSLIPYHKERVTAGQLKVTFRPDHWDRQYFPHVFGNAAQD